jgi:hypothetical protein
MTALRHSSGLGGKWNSEVRYQRSEVRSQTTDDRGQTTDDSPSAQLRAWWQAALISVIRYTGDLLLRAAVKASTTSTTSTI